MKRLFVIMAVLAIAGAGVGFAQQQRTLTDQQKVKQIDSNVAAWSAQVQLLNQQVGEALNKLADLNRRIGVSAQQKLDLQNKIKAEQADQEQKQENKE